MAEERVQRRLAAILAADVVGYSRLMEQDEAATLAVLKQRRRDILQPLVAEYDGRVVKVMGDGVLAEFASAVKAVACAVELQKRMAAANNGVAHDRHILLRIGINLGDVVVEGGDLYGDGVNVAARLQALAEPGDICMSAKVHDEVDRKLDIGFEDLGERRLKNVTVPVQLYRVRGARSPHSSIPVPLVLPDKPSIAVLPFDNLSGDPAQQYFSDGITEDIITELSRFHSLFVIARNSSFVYRGTAVDIRRVGRDLGVRFVVEGSFRKHGDRVRIAVQLIEADTGSHMWADRYDRDIGHLFELQDDVARTIAATLAGRMEHVELRDTARKRSHSLPAYDCLLHGIERLRGYAVDDNRHARELFERAVGLDPQFALAYAYLALALLVEHGYDDAPESIRDRALDIAQTAVRLDPGEGRCHQFLAQAYLYKREFDRAIYHSERSMELNPNDANGLAQRGLVLAYVGRAEEGIGAIREAMRLNPFHPEWYWAALAIPLYAARRYEEAVEADRHVAGRRNSWHLARLAGCYAQLGRLEDARAKAAEVLKQDPEFTLSAVGLRYRNPEDIQHVLEGMRKAGLPE